MANTIVEFEGRTPDDIIEIEVANTDDMTEEQITSIAQQKLDEMVGGFVQRVGAVGAPATTDEGGLPARAQNTFALAIDEFRESARNWGRTLGLNILDIAGADNANIDARLEETARIGTVEQQQAAFRIRNDVPLAVSQIADFTGQIAPEVGLGFGAGYIRSAVPRVLSEAGAGYLGGLGSDLDPERAMSNAIFGASLGGGISGGAWLATVPESTLAGSLRGNRMAGAFSPLGGPTPGAGLTGNLARQNEILFRTFDPTGRISPTASELTQSGFAAEWESLVRTDPGTRKSNFFLDREEAIVDTFDEVEQALNVRGLSTAQVVDSSLESIDNQLSKLYDNRRNAWNTSMSEAVRRTGGTVTQRGGRTTFSGGDRVIQGRVLTESLQNVVDDVTQAGKTGQIDADAQERIFNFVRDWNRRLGTGAEQGTLTVADAQKFLVDITNELEGTGRIFNGFGPREARGIANELKDAALADLDRTISSGNLGGETADLIRDARDTYKQLSRGIEGFQQLSLTRMASGQRGDFISTFLGMEPSVLRETLHELERINPQASNALRGRIIAESLDQAKTIDPATGNIRVNFKRVADDLTQGDFGAERFEALFPAGTPDATVSRARAGLEVLQRITSPVAEAGASDIGARSGAALARELALTGAEGGLGFKIRAGLSATFPGIVERALYSPQGVRALLRIGEASEGLRLRTSGGFPGARGGAATQALNAAIREFDIMLADFHADQEAVELAARNRQIGQEARRGAPQNLRQ